MLPVTDFFLPFCFGPSPLAFILFPFSFDSGFDLTPDACFFSA
jgi:hypothetical protein